MSWWMQSPSEYKKKNKKTVPVSTPPKHWSQQNPNKYKAGVESAESLRKAQQIAATPKTPPKKEPGLISKIGAGAKKAIATSDAFLDSAFGGITLNLSNLIDPLAEQIGLGEGSRKLREIKEQGKKTISPTTQKVASTAGGAIGTLVGLGGTGKVVDVAGRTLVKKAVTKPVLKKVVGKVSKPLVKQVAKEAATGAVFEGAHAIGEGKSAKEAAKAAGKGATLFGVAGPLGGAVGAGAKKVLPKAIGHYVGNIAKGAVTGAGFAAGGNLLEGGKIDKSEVAKNAAIFAALDLLTGYSLAGKIRTSLAKGKIEPVEIPETKTWVNPGRKTDFVVDSTGRARPAYIAGELPSANVPLLPRTRAETDFTADQFGNITKGSGPAGLLPPANITKPRKFSLQSAENELRQAVDDYNEAIETVQNYFKTNELRTDETARIKSEMGIDFDVLINNIEAAEKKVAQTLRGEIQSKKLGLGPATKNYLGPKLRKPGSVPTKMVGQVDWRLGKPAANLEQTQNLELPLQFKKRIAVPKPPEMPIISPKEQVNLKTATVLPKQPKATPPLNPLTAKERRFVSNSVLNAEVIPEGMKQELRRNIPKYNPISNKETWDRATQKVTSNLDRAKEEWRATESLTSADDTALGEALIVDAIKKGNIAEANSLTADLAEKLTAAGQTVQAAAILKRLTPEGMLLYANRVINKVNRRPDILKNVKKKVKLTPEEAQFITSQMQKIQTMPEGRQKDVELARVMQKIANKIPPTLSKKVATFQTISMLANPKTMVRNLMGNLLFSGAENVSQTVGTGIDKLLSSITGKRTTLLPSIKTQLKGGLRGAKQTIEDFRLGIDTSPGRTQYDLPKGQVFKGKIMGTAERLTSLGLQLGDRPFWQAAYDDALKQQMKIAKVTKPTADMIAKAEEMANYRTYQDVNRLTKLFQDIKRGLNRIGTKDFGLGDLVLKFPKTPANILARAIDYSPAQILNVVRSVTKNGFDQKRFVDAVSRGLTGTGAIILGYHLAKNGVITGQENKNKSVAMLEKAAGKMPYAFNPDALKRWVKGENPAPKTGDNYITYDWAQPISMALAIGADIFLSGKGERDATTVAIDALKSGGSTLFEQSLLQGLQRFVGGYNPVENVVETMVNAPAGFVPTISKQISQLSDNTAKEYYSPTTAGEGANLMKAKIPGLLRTLEPKIDPLGREVPMYQGGNTLFNVVFNPAFTSKYKPTPEAQLVLDLYRQTGATDQMPRTPDKYLTVGGKRYDLTPQEYTELRRIVGELTRQGLSQVDTSLPPEEQVKEIVKILNYAGKVGRDYVKQKRGIPVE